MYWSQTESSKWSLDRVSTRPGHPLLNYHISVTYSASTTGSIHLAPRAPHETSPRARAQHPIVPRHETWPPRRSRPDAPLRARALGVPCAAAWSARLPLLTLAVQVLQLPLHGLQLPLHLHHRRRHRRGSPLQPLDVGRHGLRAARRGATRGHAAWRIAVVRQRAAAAAAAAAATAAAAVAVMTGRQDGGCSWGILARRIAADGAAVGAAAASTTAVIERGIVASRHARRRGMPASGRESDSGIVAAAAIVATAAAVATSRRLHARPQGQPCAWRRGNSAGRGGGAAALQPSCERMLCTSAGSGAGDALLYGELLYGSYGDGGQDDAAGSTVAGVRARERGGGTIPLPALASLSLSGRGWIAGREAYMRPARPPAGVALGVHPNRRARRLVGTFSRSLALSPKQASLGVGASLPHASKQDSLSRPPAAGASATITPAPRSRSSSTRCASMSASSWRTRSSATPLASLASAEVAATSAAACCVAASARCTTCSMAVRASAASRSAAARIATCSFCSSSRAETRSSACRARSSASTVPRRASTPASRARSRSSARSTPPLVAARSCSPRSNSACSSPALATAASSCSVAARRSHSSHSSFPCARARSTSSRPSLSAYMACGEQPCAVRSAPSHAPRSAAEAHSSLSSRPCTLSAKPCCSATSSTGLTRLPESGTTALGWKTSISPPSLLVRPHRSSSVGTSQTPAAAAPSSSAAGALGLVASSLGAQPPLEAPATVRICSQCSRASLVGS
eukprot:scaffold50342_cov63-Phaeocystis_antarctica.AAC.2